MPRVLVIEDSPTQAQQITLVLEEAGFEVETHLLQNVDGNALPKLNQAEQKMLRPDVIVVEAIRFFPSERQNLLGSRSEIIH